MSSAAPRMARRWPLAIWLLCIAAAAVLTARAHYVADLSAFLPSTPTPEQAVLLDQLRSGAGARLLLIGIEGGTPASRSAASLQWARGLRQSGRFDSVNNGDNSQYAQVGRFLFEHRYLLSPAVDAQRFSADGLRAAIDETVSLLGTPAGTLIKPIIGRDPTGETVRMAEAMLPGDGPRSDGGAWVSRRAERAVLLATTRADGSDLDGQQAALNHLQTSFAPYRAQGLRLLVSGAGTFAVASRAQIEHEVQRLAIVGSVAVIALLLLAFGSPRALAIALLPVASGVLAGIAAVSLGFGQVHGITLGFGTTLIGEAVDYAIYYLIQARPAVAAAERATATAAATAGAAAESTAVVEGPTARSLDSTAMAAAAAGFVGHDASAAPTAGPELPSGATAPAIAPSAEPVGSAAVTGAQRWIADSWPTVRLGLWTSLCGFAALLFSGFPGLAQLGVFSIAGLIAAALTTRWVFPVLAPNGTPGRGLRRRLGRLTGACAAALPRWRLPLALLALAAAGVLAWLPSPWRGDLQSLSPVGAAALKLDEELRNDVGAGESGTLVGLSAPDEAAALAAVEAAGRRLDRLVADGSLRGYDSPARLLPSTATQLARRAALPDATTLRQRLAEATAGGPLQADQLGGFVDDVQAARQQPPLTRAALQGTPLATAVDALLVPGHESGRDGGPWRALISLQPGANGIDVAKVRAALADLPDARVVGIGSELAALYARYLHEAALQALLGALAVLALLGAHLRSWRRLLAVAQPIAAAVLIVLAGLAISGAALGILHLVGFLLVVAIGSNYALFFDQLRHVGAAGAAGDDAARTDTLASLALANLMAVVSFGVLASSSIPVLNAIGWVVAPGALLSLLLSAAFIPATGRNVRKPGEAVGK